jgi:hypothetical protein
MLTETKRRPKIPADIEEVDYPQAFIDELDRRFEVARIKIAAGELVPQTVDELATKLGIDISDIDFDSEDEDD